MLCPSSISHARFYFFIFLDQSEVFCSLHPGTEINEAGVKTLHEIWWDATNLLTRWDKFVVGGSKISAYNNYTNGNEYVFDRISGKCALFGNDAFYGWCFGNRGDYVSFC